jgi:type IV pilus assembly protein PilW
VAKHSQIQFSKGIGLTDLMVGLAIGLLAMLVILKVAVLFEARRKSTVGATDAQQNVAIAVSLMLRELRMAGNGLGPIDSLGCSVIHDLGKPLGALSLVPVSIIDGNKGAPDEINIFSSASRQTTVAASLLTAHSASDTSMQIDSTLGIQPDDRLLFYEAGKPCSLIRATAIPTGSFRVDHSSMPLLTPVTTNTTSTVVTPTALDYAVGTRVINLGSLHLVRYAIDSNSDLQSSRFNLASASWQTAGMASGIVSMQAQYGFDNRTGLQTSPQVTFWSSSMIDADGNGQAGDAGDLKRMIAIRFAVVARSSERNDQGCNASLPQWTAGDATTGKLKSMDIALNHVTNWNCFRYRVLEAEVPLRNVIWNDT